MNLWTWKTPFLEHNIMHILCSGQGKPTSTMHHSMHVLCFCLSGFISWTSSTRTSTRVMAHTTGLLDFERMRISNHILCLTSVPCMDVSKFLSVEHQILETQLCWNKDVMAAEFFGGCESVVSGFRWTLNEWEKNKSFECWATDWF